MKKKAITFIACCLLVFAMAQPGTSWSISGPVKFPTNVSGQINGIGRCTQVKFDPVAPSRMYATSASGGLWRTNDTGSTWSNVGTDYFPEMQLASICIDNTNNNILYLGTGDPNYYSGGYGVYKSTNGGASWALSNTGISTGLIIEIIIDPNNNQNLLAATDNGIFKSTNAGASWANVKNGGDFKAMVLKPNSKDTVYAVTSSQLWRSLNFGTSWQQITNGVIVPNGNGLGMRLAVSGASANVVYVGMIANEGKILKSIDFGTTFTTVYNNPAQSLVGYDALTPGQGNYNFAMTLDPSNADIVYIAAHCVWKSVDGGITWSQLTNWYADCHTDMHGIACHPTYPNMLFNINDGGIFLSRNGGPNWETKSDNIAATEVYHAAQSNLVRSQVSIGTQDNGELFMAGNAATGNSWYTNGGGDLGSKLLYSYSAANEVYYYENGNRRQVNGGQTSCNFPFVPSNNISLAFNRKVPNMGFSAYQNIYVCNNLSAPSPVWTQAGNTSGQVRALHSSLADSSVIYAFLTNNTLIRCDNIFAPNPVYVSYPSPAATNVAASIASIASNSNVVYASCGSNVYRSGNMGQSFILFSTGLPAGVNIIKLIHDEYSTDESVYLCTAKGVYYRNYTMASWQNISYNLPTIANIQEFMIYNPGTAAALLRVAYYGRGVWELPINVSQPPAVDFTVSEQIICANTTVQFTDLSVGTPSPTTWQWSFPGGSPATSTNQNPAVLYTTPGNYPVTLVAGNTNGTGSLTIQAYIQVLLPQALPVSEGFVGTYPPGQWTFYDDGQDNVLWQQSNTVGGYNTSAQSTFFDNYSSDVNNKRDKLITKLYDFSGITNPVMWFDVAYARWGAGYSDSMMVMASTNCGLTWSSIYYKGGVQLATSPDNQSFFVPTPTQWRTETVNLSAFSGQPSVMFAFQNRGHYGNVIYIDNINLFSQAPVDAGISAVLSPTPLSCYAWAMPMIIGITNYGSSVISNIPVTLTVSGASNQTLSSTYAGILSPGASATFNMGNVTMSASGVYTFSVSTGLAGDGNTWNNLNVSTFTTAPLFTVNNPGQICAGSSATLTVNGNAASYAWSTGATTSSLVVNPSATAVYSVTGTNAQGCASIQSLTLSVQNPTIAGIGAMVCENTTGQLSVNAFPASIVNWYASPGSTVPLATGNSFTANPSVTTTYYAQAASAQCGSQKIPVTLTVTPLPPVTITAGNTEICAGESATLTADGAADYTWTPGGATAASIVVIPASTTAYSVTGTANGCSATDSALLVVDICDAIAAYGSAGENISLYPNPNNGNISITFQHFKNIDCIFEISDLTGRIVYRTALKKDESQLSIKELANGMYNYKILSSPGIEFIKSGKLVKQ